MKKTYLLRAGVIVTLAAAVLAMVPGKAQAQAAGPISKYIVSDDVAKRTLMKYVLNADTARAIVDGCIKWQKKGLFLPFHLKHAFLALQEAHDHFPPVLPFGVEMRRFVVV